MRAAALRQCIELDPGNGQRDGDDREQRTRHALSRSGTARARARARRGPLRAVRLPRVPSAIWCRQLVPSATISVSGRGRAHGRQQRQLRHPQRDVVVRRLVAEAAGHAAAARLDHVDGEARNETQHLAHRAHRVERLLVAMAVQQRARLRAAARAASARRPARCSRARNSSIRNARSARRRCAVAQSHHQELVAQRQQARRLEPDDDGAALDVRRERGHDAARLGFRLVDETRGEVRAAAAQRPPWRGVGAARPRDVHAVAGRLQHRHRRVRVLRLEVIGERVDEQHDVGAAGIARRAGVPDPRRNVSRRHAGSVRCAENPSQPFAEAAPRPGSVSRRLASHGSARRPRRPARQVRDQPLGATTGRARAATGGGTRSSSSPCRRRSGIRAGSPCSSRTGRARRAPPRTRARRARAGPTARAAACWRGRA